MYWRSQLLICFKYYNMMDWQQASFIKFSFFNLFAKIEFKKKSKKKHNIWWRITFFMYKVEFSSKKFVIVIKKISK